MSEIISEHTDLSEPDHLWLKLLVSEWQLLADLSFSDLVLWVRDHDPSVFWAAAQIRPFTGVTSLFDDVVGDLIAYSPEHLVAEAFSRGEIVQTSERKLQAGVPVQTHAVPVTVGNQVIAVVEQRTSQLGLRAPSSLENAYLESGVELARMITVGAFPIPSDATHLAFSPRVGDGFIRLDPAGDVTYASPNAVSAYRRLGLRGDLIGEQLATLTAELLPAGPDPLDESVQSVLSGRTARRTELVSGEAHLMVRVLPLTDRRERVGTVVLCRDVSDLRSKERELVTKDATIREIHHRVKNNLQTVAALLRLQARRIDVPEGREALEEAVRRVGSIAIVHETLSQAFDEFVDFDDVADRLRVMVAEVSSTGASVRTVRDGSFGTLTAEVATPLAMVLTEVLQNAVEHGFRDGEGTVVLAAQRLVGRLRVSVDDDGVGLPEGFDLDGSTSLGLSIVRTLVESELDGQLEMGPAPGGGTRVVLDIPAG